MQNKEWTQERSEQLSKLIRKVELWSYSTRPRTAIGKNSSRINATKHGLSAESLRNYRKTKRSKEIIELEKLCGRLTKAIQDDNSADVGPLLEELEQKYNDFVRNRDNSNLPDHTAIESFYSTVQLSKTLNFSLRKVMANVQESICRGFLGNPSLPCQSLLFEFFRQS